MPHILLTALALLTAAALAQPQTSIFKDPLDGKTYRTVKIGEQTWFAENLQFESLGSKCYANKPENCKKYGRLYDLETALNACPGGWHLPTNEEWDELFHTVDSSYVMGNRRSKGKYVVWDGGHSDIAGKRLKAKTGWSYNYFEEKGGNGTDDYGFAALPGGEGHTDGGFYNFNDGEWWSATRSNSVSAYYYYMTDFGDVTNNNTDHQQYLHSVRCVRD